MLTTVAIISYFVGFAFRFDPVRVHSHSRVILAVNSVLWHMKTFVENKLFVRKFFKVLITCRYIPELDLILLWLVKWF